MDWNLANWRRLAANVVLSMAFNVFDYRRGRKRAVKRWEKVLSPVSKACFVDFRSCKMSEHIPESWKFH